MASFIHEQSRQRHTNNSPSHPHLVSLLPRHSISLPLAIELCEYSDFNLNPNPKYLASVTTNINCIVCIRFTSSYAVFLRRIRLLLRRNSYYDREPLEWPNGGEEGSLQGGVWVDARGGASVRIAEQNWEEVREGLLRLKSEDEPPVIVASFSTVRRSVEKREQRVGSDSTLVNTEWDVVRLGLAKEKGRAYGDQRGLGDEKTVHPAFREDPVVDHAELEEIESLRLMSAKVISTDSSTSNLGLTVDALRDNDPVKTTKQGRLRNWFFGKTNESSSLVSN